MSISIQKNISFLKKKLGRKGKTTENTKLTESGFAVHSKCYVKCYCMPLLIGHYYWKLVNWFL